ncbi:MAG: glycosyltransferase family 4 protein, partial [Deltaproteobacteria bacterium]|nr:glycosyltransferase family 4 protein [Deltaproteobacteria bacterium]
MKLKILYIVPSTGRGGAETFISHTAYLHDPVKFEITYALLRPGPLEHELQNTKWHVFVYTEKFRLSRPWSIFKIIKWLRVLIRAEKIQLVHSTMAYGALLGAIAAYLEKVPHIWFQHGPVSGWMDLLAQILPCRKILVNSQHTLMAQEKLKNKYILLKYFIPVRQTVVIYLGVNFKQIYPWILNDKSTLLIRNQWGFKKDDFLVGVLARLNPQKGIKLFIEALALVNEKNVYGLIFGAEPDSISGQGFKRQLEEQASLLNSPVRFLGEAKELWQIMVALDVVVCSSITP